MNNHQFRIIVTLLTMIYNAIKPEGHAEVYYNESTSELVS